MGEDRNSKQLQRGLDLEREQRTVVKHDARER